MTANDYQILFFVCLAVIIVWKLCEIINKRRKASQKQKETKYTEFRKLSRITNSVMIEKPPVDYKMNVLFNSSKKILLSYNIIKEDDDFFLEAFGYKCNLLTDSLLGYYIEVSFYATSECTKRIIQRLEFNKELNLISFSEIKDTQLQNSQD